jgi:hypothetical protein
LVQVNSCTWGEDILCRCETMPKYDHHSTAFLATDTEQI